MRILVLTPRYPYPLIGGDKIRLYYIARGLKEAGHELSLLSFVESERDADEHGRKKLGSIFGSVRTVRLPKWRSYLNVLLGLLSGASLQTLYYRSGKMQALVDQELGSGRYDAVLVHLTRMAPYVIDPERPVLSGVEASRRIGKNRVRKVLEMTDALSLNYARSREQGSRGFLGKVYRVEEARAMEYERECVEKFDLSVVVSSIDRDYLIRGIGGAAAKKVLVMPHGISDELFNVSRGNLDPDLIVFIGNLRTHQNNDAVLYFVRDIYPLIRAGRPQARLRIVGANPSALVMRLHGKNGVEVTEKVPNIAEHVLSASLSVCPVRIGAGVQGKVLESMAMGIPVLTTPTGVEGIDGAVAGEHLLVARNPREFADTVLRLMDDSVFRETLAKNGRALAEERYRYSEIGKKYAETVFNKDF